MSLATIKSLQYVTDFCLTPVAYFFNGQIFYLFRTLPKSIYKNYATSVIMDITHKEVDSRLNTITPVCTVAFFER